ncbi:hypothetical protein GCM10007423_51100 [Dyadobacter endophyticus]|uniref:DKNYY family protein n=1 Tax=Dyadobacter endophyticus TaxID=1749036 RepID=A0ABQ1Z706_9BACT|nr:hypothetical protein [Dyadobacter endophyticus]GGH49251.1 hypothetical protein GCM10007423_51100 [Dyadobacter endophyticus]
MENTIARILFIVLAICPYLAHAQQPKVFKVKAGEYPDKVIPYADRYQFGQFTTGKADFVDGRTSQARFNYNYIGGHVLFVDAKLDTLEIIDKAILKNITIGDKSYRFDKRFGYCEVVGTFNRASLGKREVLARIGTEKGGPYGISYTASSVTTYRSYSSDQAAASKKLNPDAAGVFSHRTAYYLIDNNNRFYIPTAGSLKKLYPAHKKAIDQYLRTNPADFGKEQDLIRLLTYCDTLPK